MTASPSPRSDGPLRSWRKAPPPRLTWREALFLTAALGWVLAIVMSDRAVPRMPGAPVFASATGAG